jgi:cysteinyl-tRNA synthetase
MLKIYNSLTNKKETFKPIHNNHVGMYVCGITVYDYCHLGHARSMVAFDIIRRHLLGLGYEVKFVKNITDIDDKIIQRANENQESINHLTERMIDAMHRDEKALNILPPTIEPKATTHIEEIQSLIQTLLNTNHAYIGDSGDVLFNVASFNDYGKLSKKDLTTLESGIRVAVDKQKHSPFDFVLWKKAKPQEPAWDSPWGAGRPGWHIECSAMAIKCLGDNFDIHGGGFDLQFPHHENEIAQSECATGKPFANYWLHAGFLQINNEKMSKSLNNFHTIDNILKVYHPETLRYFLLSSHYRSQLNFTPEHLNQAHNSLKKLYRQAKEALDKKASQEDLVSHWVAQFDKAMNDDFNTPQALAVLFELVHAINREADQSSKQLTKLKHTLVHLGNRLGLFAYKAQDVLDENFSEVEKENINQLIQARTDARTNKDFAQADKIRDDLLAKGIELLDSPEGTTWRRK